MSKNIFKSFLENQIYQFISSEIFKILLLLEKPTNYNNKNHFLRFLKDLESKDENIYIIYLKDFDNVSNYFKGLMNLILEQLTFNQEENFEGLIEIKIFREKYKNKLTVDNITNLNGKFFVKFFTDLHILLAEQIGFLGKLIIVLDPERIQLKEEYRDSIFNFIIDSKLKIIKFIIVEKKNQNLFSDLNSNLIVKMIFPFDEDGALNFLLQTIQTAEKNEMSNELLTQTYLAIANIYLSKSNWNQMFFYYYKALEMVEKTGNKKDKSLILSNIATAHFMNKKMEEALEFYGQSLQLSKEINLSNLSIYNLNAISLVHTQKKNIDRAIETKMQAVEISNNSEEFQTSASILGDIGILYYKKTDYENSIEFINKSIELTKEKKMNFEYSKQLKNLGKVYEKLNRIEESKIHLSNANEIEKREGFTAMSDFEVDPEL